MHIDVLVVGGGGAACRAAIAAADQDAQVLMVLKNTVGHSGATTHKCCEIAGYNVPGCGDPQDNEEVYYSDIMSAAMGMADPELVQLLVENAGPRFEDLRRWGVSPAVQDGREVIMKGCYSSRRRGYTIEGHGDPIVQALLAQIEKRRIARMENATVVDLIVKEGRCCGAMVLDEAGQIQLIEAGAVILATGGASQVFLQNLNPSDVSGDGYSLAYDHGAVLKNMEFMQAGIGFFHPVKSLFNTYLWAGFPFLTNARGELFLEKYLPAGLTSKDVMLEHCRHFPFSSRDISRYLEIGIQKELAAGGGDARMCLPVSFTHFTPEYIQNLDYDADLKQLWPMVQTHFKESGVDICREVVGITCVAQAINGGITIDHRAMSTLPGLFAAGETAAGPHGADRLGGNMMGTCQVFGEISGREAAGFAQKNGRIPLCEEDARQAERMYAALFRDVDSAEMIQQLQCLAQENLFICRTQQKLNRMLLEIERLEDAFWSSPAADNPSTQNISLYHLLNSARLMTLAASARKESRGSHYREDYPASNPAYEMQITLKK
ncbi:FAD-binding protein [Anaerotruncus rubiinfantis]|uniref:FAD-binding protein n=1 Tax=Anaerotruncus rubiinfantis TaxID=1720200 RepID=UPI00082D2E62|nr:FAD-binding protein [Anaerotruncus rubiinfantis]